MSQRLSKPFWPPALASQAPPAIILAVLRRFRGPALFGGPRPSSRQGVPFWPSGLTLRSSGLAKGQPLTFIVSLRKTRFIQPHVLFTGIYFLKRLFVGFWVSCRASPFGAAPVQAFLASSACTACASSFCFRSILGLAALWLTGQSSRPAFGGRLTFVR